MRIVAAKPTHLWVALAIALYLFFSLAHLDLPGLHYDEVNFVNAALGDVDGSFISWKIKVFGKDVPLMIMKYIGALKPAIYAPVFHIFGTGAVTARMPVVCIGALTLLVSYGLFRRMFPGAVALAGLFLFATDPTFIFANRLDWGPVSLMLALEISSLYFFWRWMKEEKRLFLALSGFLLGLGLYNKFIFIWYIAALFVSLSLLYHKTILRLLGRRNLACFLPAFLLGCLPLIAFNIAIPAGTFRNEKVVATNLAESLRYHYAIFRTTMDGSAIYYFVNQEDAADPAGQAEMPDAGKMDSFINRLAGFPWIRRTLTPFAFAGSVMAVLIMWGAGRLRWKREILLLVSQWFLIAGFICLSAKATGAHHAVAFYPLLFVTIACAVCDLGRNLVKPETARNILVSACVAALVFPQLVLDARYLKSFATKGGVGLWSDAIYDLSAFSQQYPDKNFIFMEWGFNTQILLLSAGRIRKEEFVCERPSLEACIEPLLTKTNACLVFHCPPFELTPVFEHYKRLLAAHHLHNRIVKIFYQRDGRPVYMACEILHPHKKPSASGDRAPGCAAAVEAR